ncbi:MAG: molybdopterin-dependent oxidoreductase [Betaproteobacteria bacterium]|nr:molybdopterin-dependent oxidoreductase [Betaproteobacteria bacterium]
MKLDILNTAISRRRFLQVSGVTGAAAAAGLGLEQVTGQVVTDAKATAAESKTVITKNVCNQCPARCGVDVYTTDGRVHAMYGSLESPISNGKLCPKGYLGAYILYDPDRFKGPMKRTNPKKGRDEDPKFVPISWDEALKTVADRLNALRDKGESHRFALLFGRGWGASDAGLLGTFGRVYGSPNAAIGHSSTCADASKKAKRLLDGNYDYNAYDYANTNYMLIFGASFLEAYRPYNNNLQVWGHIRTKSPKTKVTAVDVHWNTTISGADRALLIKPGTDGALALAIAHVILTEGLWDRNFVGDFKDAVNRFKVGEATLNPADFNEKWTKGLVEWWNAELKDRTPKWAAGITTIAERDIVTVARELATTKPAMVLFERGPTAHSNGVYNGMAIHALNALIGSMYAEGGLMNQMGVPYGKLPVSSDDFMDEYAKSDDRKQYPRIDLVGKDWLMASNQIQAIPAHHLAGKPYKLDTILFYMTAPIYSAPEARKWEEALQTMYVIDTSPFPGETAMFADLVLPDHTYLERLQDAPTYPFQGWPMATLRVPAVKPLYDTKVFGDTLIEIGKRIKGPMGEYYKALGSTENVIKHLAKGFEDKPGTNSVNSFESWKEKGVWYKKPYLWRQVRGEFYEWDGTGYNKPMKPEDVKAKLLKTKSGKFEFKSSYLEDEHYAEYVHEKTGVPLERVGFPQWVEPKFYGGGDLHFISPKVALQAEGRAGNLPHATTIAQPVVGGKKTIYDGDRVRIKSEVGRIEAIARHYEGVRPDTVILPNILGHWAQGRWARQNRLPTGSASEVIVNKSEPISGLASYYATKVTVERV